MARIHDVAFLAFALLAAPNAPALAAGGRQPVAPVQLSAVEVSLDGPFVRITVRGTSALPAVTPVPTSDGPPRVFVDLPGVDPGQVPAAVTGRAIVRRVRVALNSANPPITRLVLDLAGAVTTAVVPGGAELTIVVASAPAAAAAPTVVPAPTPAPASAPAKTAPTAVPRPSRGSGPQPAPGRPQPAPVPIATVAVAATPAAAAPAATTSAAPAMAPPSVVAAPTPAGQAAPAAQATSAAQTPPAPSPRTSQYAGFGAPRAMRPTGRVSVYTSAAKTAQTGGFNTNYGDVTTAVSYQFTERDTDGVEYGLDLRHTAYSIAGRDPRVSVYTGYVGGRLADGALRVRAGHLWLDDLGGLGAVAGAQIEGRSGDIPTTGLGRWRGGLFGGLDPDVYNFGYGDGVRKAGGYLALEGTRGRRHVAGYVNIHNGSLTERSVLTVTNFVPAGPVFVYQSAEYDLSPTAGGQGHDGLSYFFTNARVNAGRKVELMGTASRGRSVDTRGLSDDIQAGRPVSQQSIDGLRYQSLGGRATVEVLPRMRLYAGYSRDKNNRDDVATGRWLAGGYGGNLFGTGLDLTFSNSRTTQSTGSYHSTFVSVGRELGRRAYATAEYSTALSQVRFVRGDGLVIDSKPKTNRIGANASVILWRATSLLLSVERTTDDGYQELRAVTGLTFRLR